MMRKALLLASLLAALSAAAERFVPLGVSEGLGSRRVYQIQQDAEGYLWFYTQGSIDRYDGFAVRHYVLGHEAVEGNYIPTANSLALDGNGDLLVIQTNGRIYRYDRERDAFTPASAVSNGFLYTAFPDGKETWLGTSEGLVSLSDGTVRLPERTIFAIARYDGTLYLGTDAGIYRYDGASCLRVADIPPFYVTSLYAAEDGRLYIGTFSDGACCYEAGSGRCQEVDPLFPHSPVRSIVAWEERILFGTDGEGIVIYDPAAERICGRYVSSDQDGGLCANTVSDLTVDRQGILWVTTSTDGVCFLDRDRLDVQWIRHRPGDARSLVSDHVNAVLEDSRGRIWFGTNKGLCRYDGHGWRDFQVPEAPIILALAEDREGSVWAGGYGVPVFRVDRSDRVRRLVPEGFHYTFALCTEGDGLWIGGLNDALTRQDLSDDTRISFPATNIWAFVPTPAGEIWAVSNLGIGSVDEQGGTVAWSDLPASDRTAWCATADDEGRIWVGTQQEGILCFHPADGTCRTYPVGETVVGITADRDGRIWAVSEDLIYRLDPAVGVPVVMNHFLGIGSGRFNHTASTRLSDGNLVFGTAEGALRFDPAKVDGGKIAPVEPVLTDFRLLSGDGTALQRITKGWAVNGLDQVVLRASERSFALSFSAIAFASQARIRFDYRLEGYDAAPRSSLAAATVEYVGISPGRYTFIVKAVDTLTGDVLGSHALRIKVRRPPLLSSPAIAAYVLLLAAVLWFLDRYRRRKLLRRMTQERLDTFIRFAHELKTPVSLIKGPLAALDKDPSLPEKDRASVSTAMRNADRLMTMVNSLLELRENGSEEARLRLEAFDLRDYLGETLDAFLPTARQKGISLSYTVSDGLGEVPIDREKMDRIVQNLVSNAVKYTERGSVELTASPAGRMWRLTVKDTGIGIPAAVRSRIFTGGVRAANARNVDETGYGIGLMITRQLVLLHRGTISLDSEEGNGSVFTLLFPLEYRASEGTVVTPEPEEESRDGFPSGGTRARILVVEDDAEMLRYLQEILSAEFETLTAPDGNAALRMAEEMQPDLVLSDVIMPGMNGFEVCRSLKSSLPTSHIPVILLTAMDDKEHVILGLESGSDDYIVKPFDPQVLSARISNLLHERERLRTLVLRSGREEKRREYTNRLDKEFMEKVLAVVEASYSDPGFQIDDLCRSMAMSRTAFFNKLKALTGKAPNDFIRIFRLDKAKEMLAAGGMTIAEVADRVGFSDAKYFSSCFKRQFGVSPSKY